MGSAHKKHRSAQEKETNRAGIPAEQAQILSIRDICAGNNWADLLAQRWGLEASTIRRWARIGLFGEVGRFHVARIWVSSFRVAAFETRWSIALGRGEKALTLAQCAKRYRIPERTLRRWRQNHGFPQPVRIPRTAVSRVPLRILVAWEKHWGLSVYEEEPR